MNTFLPYPDFTQSAQALDWRRLGKQRSEALTILRGKWRHHPASRMWQGHFYQLGWYGLAVCKEWIRRGYNDHVCQSAILEEINKHKDTGVPPWLGRPDFHRSHQSNLIRKLPSYYAPQFPGVPDDLPYIWPVRG